MPISVILALCSASVQASDPVLRCKGADCIPRGGYVLLPHNPFWFVAHVMPCQPFPCSDSVSDVGLVVGVMFEVRLYHFVPFRA